LGYDFKNTVEFAQVKDGIPYVPLYFETSARCRCKLCGSARIYRWVVEEARSKMAIAPTHKAQKTTGKNKSHNRGATFHERLLFGFKQKILNLDF